MNKIIESPQTNPLPFDPLSQDDQQSPKPPCAQWCRNAIAEQLQKLKFDGVKKLGEEGLVATLMNGTGKTVYLWADFERFGRQGQSCDSKHDEEPGESHHLNGCECEHKQTTVKLLTASIALQAALLGWSGTLVCLVEPGSGQ